ncbi:undecaprenyldiphospho-muramoylpentapeptide beta-N-acetylglucosaminyltransferase [Ruminococcus sp.]|uniref:undecaprenyldiphospho-muramoylpentapeptide beta-N-acetylglucosaminyltransferase n=1 Tax=Ruminococcus sp. TaxID=41978 RepID=UPI002629247C|nr:undecaprenyldiphospho-muramoylpentapeptide beta-N-acetylglucosaminyltransferase [Ruminococcus sp.]MDD7555611.1 undecaprenyldiphospho-muramoylpentapeptide beta-N-acetylglucosaminyltransferase [Ruminococcus sp.]MDY4963337.1 undecaprenyldiphospho-muramoylpentapeptide beta-N-acetylglucosaminyltransferase [Ruminococcus callidus]
MKVLLAGGGTGGHINPALAIASIIRQHDPGAEFLFAGTPNGMEARLIPQAGYPIEFINVAGFQRRLSLKNIKRNAQALRYLATSGKRAKEIVTGFGPDIAIGTGGYVSGPVIRMAAKLGVPCAIHEQNAYPGVTNKLLAKEVSHVMLTFKEALQYLDKNVNYTVTGLPVRASILQESRAEARKKLGFDDGMCILSFGGSLGAGCINETMAEVIHWHTANQLKINHIHGYGGMGRESFPKTMQDMGVDLSNPRLRISEYINDMDVCLAAADLVVCRAGASTLAELEAVGRASLLIPSPVVTGNHQFHNASVLGKAGAAIVIEQKDVTPAGIVEQVKALYEHPEKLQSMAKHAAELAIPDTDERIYKVISSLQKA